MNDDDTTPRSPRSNASSSSLQTRLMEQFRHHLTFKPANVEEAEEEALFHTFELVAQDDRDKTASSITVDELEQASRVLGRASTQAMSNASLVAVNEGATIQLGPGIPTCLATHSKLIFVGTSNSMVLTFDHFGTYRGVLGGVLNTNAKTTLRSTTSAAALNFNDLEETLLTNLATAVPMRDLERAGGVTSIDTLNHTNQLVAGYGDGRVVFWDVTTSSVVKSIDPPGGVVSFPLASNATAVSWIRFLSPSFCASCSRSGMISTIRLQKVFLLSTAERKLLLDSSANPPLAFSAAYSHLAFTSATFSPQASTTTFVTTVVGLEPDPPRVLQKLSFVFSESLPNALTTGDNSKMARGFSSMPTCLSWGKIEAGGGTGKLALAISHGDSLRIIHPREDGVSLRTSGGGVHGRM